MRKKLGFIVATICGTLVAHAQTSDSARQSEWSNQWSNHFQLTVINQIHSGFKAAYSGPNSLSDSVEPAATSVTTTMFLGRKLWKNAAVYANPEVSGGRGLSYSVGVAGALNGETYRIGNPEPVLSLSRAYFQQSFPIGRTTCDTVADGVNQVADLIPTHRITLTAGKFSMSDFYDRNAYSHDPRSQFLNWALMSNGAWDYPADVKGYTSGLVVEWYSPKWAARLSSVAVPVIANHPKMEYVFRNAHSETVELERHLRIGPRQGTIRLLFSYTADRAPSYKAGLRALQTGDTALLDVISGNAEGASYGGHKAGIGVNIDQELTERIGFFARGGWNDGKDATWAFTEIDQTVSAGLSFKGGPWNRLDDVFAIAGVVNGISADHRAFLKAGGSGFIIGDGTLNYGHESILETYYNGRLYEHVYLTLDYQFVANPAYNKDRHGPVHVLAIRGHIEF
ncbi:MAG TPA: carbohydrate porin [Puia sp.]|nr:carbohydrate porin [Puia sp.]